MRLGFCYFVLFWNTAAFNFANNCIIGKQLHNKEKIHFENMCNLNPRLSVLKAKILHP